MISSKTLVSGDPRSEDLLVSYAWALETDNQESTLLFMVFNLASFKIEGRLLTTQLLQTGGLLIPNEQGNHLHHKVCSRNKARLDSLL